MTAKMDQFEIKMLVTFTTTVTVEARNVIEAADLAEKFMVMDDGMDRAEMVDWSVRSAPAKVEQS